MNRDTLDEYAPEGTEDWSDYDEDFEYDGLTTARYDDHGFLPGREQTSKRRQFLRELLTIKRSGTWMTSLTQMRKKRQNRPMERMRQ